MKKFNIYGVSTPEESKREKEHKALAELAAAEGMVLLKNDGVLPLKTKTVALYGPGSRRTVKGGSGSGDVRERHSVTIEEGLKNAGFTFPTTLWMDRFEEKYQSDTKKWKQSVDDMIKGYSPIRTMDMFIKIGENPKPYPECTPIYEDELCSDTDTAIYVLSRQAGEGSDRHIKAGDYLLSKVERESLEVLSKHYKNFILVLNCGSIIDLSVLDDIRIDAVILYSQAGMSGGNAFAKLILGESNFCGKLTDTWGYNYSDYPSADTFSHMNGDTENENYYEGIYVGYRYFTSFDVKPRFPFGFGLSYTEFDYKFISAKSNGAEITVNAEVSNKGKFDGKEILQLYISKPCDKYDCEKYALASFAKTGTLAPGEQQKLKLSFNICNYAVYDGNNEHFVLPKGDYALLLGDCIDNAMPVAKFNLSDDVITECAKSISSNKPDFEDITAPEYVSEISENITELKVDLSSVEPVIHKKHSNDFSDKIKAKLNNISKEDKVSLCVGGGYSVRCFNNVMGAAGRTCTKLLKKGIPNIVMSDGPAGLNVVPYTAVGKEGFPRYPGGLPDDWKWGWLEKSEGFLKRFKGKYQLYHYMTAWPNATMLAQSWNTDLIEKVGRAIGKEMLEIGVSVWLAPGFNIHRNPLCGRNFEYYSEDPLVSGKMAAAITNGIQGCDGVGVSIKHFCCNNQEDNRTGVSENLSQRALREIYLKGFRIAVNESKPWTVMSSYNKVNGEYVCNSKALLTGVLRDEWGFEGLVMSDWNATEQCSYAKAVNAGNDLIMPGTKQVKQKLLADGELDSEALNKSAARVLRMIFNSETCKDFL